jgi:hypothetical protein
MNNLILQLLQREYSDLYSSFRANILILKLLQGKYSDIKAPSG